MPPGIIGAMKAIPRVRFIACAVAILLSAGACKATPDTNGAGGSDESPATDPATDPDESSVLLSIVGTNDVHGALDRMPIFAGFVANLRARRAAPGDEAGAVVLIDAGDMFQGTLESNLNEGAAMVDVFNALGYAAAAVGNHEFDFGPAGPAASPSSPADDPRGALRARFDQAKFPILAANYLDSKTGRRMDWPGAPASVVHEVEGVKVGIVGVGTITTTRITMAANVVGLQMAPLSETIIREASALRARGAQVVVVTAHAGGACKNLDNPDDLGSCDADDEIMAVARALPPGLVDIIVGGHTHRAMAHRVNGVVIIESYSRMRAFGRVDLRIERGRVAAGSSVTVVAIHPPRDLCPGRKRVPVAECEPGEYEGAPVRADARLSEIIAPAMAAAQARKQERLGVVLSAPVTRDYREPSALGNLIADLMRTAQGGDIAITNGGGLRANLPAGPLSYGALYESTPFDNRFATVTMTVADFERMLGNNLRAKAGIVSMSGARAPRRSARTARRWSRSAMSEASQWTINAH